MPDNEEHEELKKIIKSFLEKCDFEIVDTEVNFDFDGDGQSDFSIDVCAVFEKYLIAIECKSSQLSSPKAKIKSALANMKNVIKLNDQKIILKTDQKTLTNKRLKKI